MRMRGWEVNGGRRESPWMAAWASLVHEGTQYGGAPGDEVQVKEERRRGTGAGERERGKGKGAA